MAAACVAAAAVEAGKGVFTAGFMRSVTFVALPVTGFVAVEVIEPLFTASGERAVITVVRVETVVHVAIEPMWPMKPGAGSDEHATVEPIRPVISVRSAVVRGVVKIAIRAYGSNPDADRDLRRRNLGRAQERHAYGRDSKRFSGEHKFSSLRLEQGNRP
jgi:hypothetical protein